MHGGLRCARFPHNKFINLEDNVKRVFGSILLGLGVFLLVLAPMLKFYAVPKLALAPMDVDSISTGQGVLVKKLNPEKISAFPNIYDTNIPVKTTRYTVADTAAAEESSEANTGVYNTFIRINQVGGEQTLLSASTATYAFNRANSEMINCCGANANEQSMDFTGVMPLKFPFFPEKGTIEVWDDTLGTTIPFEFVEEKDLFGYTVYEYRTVVPPTQLPGSKPFISLPASTLGQPGDGNIDLYAFQAYDNTLLVQPTTGELLGGVTKQKQTLRTKGSSTDLVVVSEAEITGDSTEESTKESFATGDTLNTLNSTAPILLLILGVIFIIIGILLVRRPSGGSPAPAAGKPSIVS